MELEEFYRLKNGTTIYGVFNQIREYLGYQAVDYSKMTYRDTVKPPTEVRESSFNGVYNKQTTTLDSVIEEASKEVLPRYYFVSDSGINANVLQEEVNSIIEEQLKLKRTLKIMKVGSGEFSGLHLYFEDMS